MKLLLLEDDYLYRISLVDFLEQNGYSVDAFDNGNDALEAAFSNNYALMLLDIRVPGIDGYTLLREVRNGGLDTPVVMLTSLTDIEDLSKGYELGCSDYLRKPFEMKELKYRIEHLIKHDTYKSNSNIVKIDDSFSFDIRNQTLIKDGKNVDLSAIEIKLVSYLVQQLGYYVSMESLHQDVWEGKDITYADIRMCIKRVRAKCGKSFIKNKKMVGYCIGK